MKFLDVFIEDCRYYDPKNIELKTILKYVKLRGKTLLDVGTGIGRLSFPLSKYAKEIVSLDKDKRFLEYFRGKKRKNLSFINQNAEKYLKKDKKFDVILLAWPTINFKFIKLIKNVMHKNSLFIFITCDNNSDYEIIINKLDIIKKNYFGKDIKNKIKFIKEIPRRFRLIIKKKFSTEYLYPNEKIAFRVIKNGLMLWFKIKWNKNAEEKLKKIIDKHKIGKKVRFKERIYFYILKK
ncbi:MAG: class I SAM-dependent methyltransferase [Nanoarchaeota archaeon]